MNKETNKRLALMNDKEWVKTINELKTMKCDNENKVYMVVYKEGNQRENRRFQFHNVGHDDDTNSFIFKSFTPDENDLLTDEIYDRKVLVDIDIVKLEIEDVEDGSGCCFI